MARHQNSHLHALSHNRRPHKEPGAALKTNWEDVGGVSRGVETNNLPGSFALESILADRCTATKKDPEPDQV